MTSLEQWLAAATNGLSAESAARVRAEIQEHCASAREAGGDAVAALGDPRSANRGYRKVLLTEQEAILAPVLTQARPTSLEKRVLGVVPLMAFFWWISGKQSSPGFWQVNLAILSTLPLSWFWPQTTLERSRIYLYIHAVRNAVVVAVAWWYQGWIGAVALGGLCFGLDYVTSYRRLMIFRKLAAGQTYSLLPGAPGLTRLDAIWLHNLRKGLSPLDIVTVTLMFLMLAGAAVWRPTAFAPMFVWMAASFVLPRPLPIYTAERSRWVRIVKWAAMVVAAVLPFLFGAPMPWMGAFMMAPFFVLFDVRHILLRRKLPIEQWPKRLYF